MIHLNISLKFKQYSLEFSNKNSNIEIDNDEINLLPWDAFIFVK